MSPYRRYSYDDEPYYPYYPPTQRRAANGIKAKSTRGAIGQTWWSQRFIAVLESFNMGGRLARGRSYARTGQVLDLSVSAGVVTARVQGSRAKPYVVSIEVAAFSERDWAAAETALTENALFLATLLAGDMPQDIGDAFQARGLSLFPGSRRELVSACSCPDSANPCKHIAATYYILAEAFDEDPFLILAWRGRPKDVLLANLRVLRRGSSEEPAGASPPSSDVVAMAALEDCLDTFWAAGPELSDLRIRPQAAVVPDAVLRELDPLDVGVGAGLAEVLRPAYERMVALAEEAGSAQLDDPAST